MPRPARRGRSLLLAGGMEGAAARAYDRGRQRLAACGAEAGAAVSVGDRRTTGRAAARIGVRGTDLLF
ncbi:hypothetical protein WJ0W_005296 [Paenibacillus melissococcoides]|uniref:Uncharacterized protein n=1 Tax=Paenibacillus melissococcoides TaxID=2912268 RepID=A0ABM9G8E3_9BACL|nr:MULTISPECIES: hypothetical protein [Paenibacillus]MEB9897654.1 hypothetical protein [Bacillus cereus]CAH8248041.1 hypothetical protein WJ0W_005296 [Paenibacillus melissococcoides]CAH8718791.1 hypothetical protein HTL2_005394 [Paenibacillus melissococcoides]CAH8719795.1 hypothetical protein WDD9_005668 [Paenibacillus melissococcoides]